jgi:hypothetical protein
VRVMTGGGRNASDLIVYLDRSDIREGRLEELRTGIRRLVEVIESLEPQLVVYRIHIDDDAGQMTVVAVHPDSESLELHMEVGRAQFRSLADLVTLRHIEVCTAASARRHARCSSRRR